MSNDENGTQGEFNFEEFDLRSELESVLEEAGIEPVSHSDFEAIYAAIVGFGSHVYQQTIKSAPDEISVNEARNKAGEAQSIMVGLTCLKLALTNINLGKYMILMSPEDLQQIIAANSQILEQTLSEHGIEG